MSWEFIVYVKESAKETFSYFVFEKYKKGFPDKDHLIKTVQDGRNGISVAIEDEFKKGDSITTLDKVIIESDKDNIWIKKPVDDRFLSSMYEYIESHNYEK